MKNTGKRQSNFIGELLGEMTEAKTSGLAFSFAALLPYVLSVIFAIVGAIFGLFYEGCEKDDWYLYVSYLLSQVSFALTAVAFFTLSKTSVKTVIGKPKAMDFVLAIVLQFGMLSLANVNSWFLEFLKTLGLSAPVPKIPSLDGFGFVGVLFVVALLPAIFEETLFRGNLLKGLKGFPVWAAAMICGALFSIFHQNPAQTIYQFLCGTAFALIVLRSGSILPTVVAHFLNNALIICAEKYAWRLDTLPIMIDSAVCLVWALAYLIVGLVGMNKNSEQKTVEKSDKKHFFLTASVGILLCVINWVAKLLGA